MDAQEIDKQLVAFPRRKAAIERQIVDAARRVSPVLKDAGRMHSAAEFDELFFQLDALDEEMKAFIEGDPRAVVGRLLAAIDGRNKDSK